MPRSQVVMAFLLMVCFGSLLMGVLLMLGSNPEPAVPSAPVTMYREVPGPTKTVTVEAQNIEACREVAAASMELSQKVGEFTKETGVTTQALTKAQKAITERDMQALNDALASIQSTEDTMAGPIVRILELQDRLPELVQACES